MYNFRNILGAAKRNSLLAPAIVISVAALGASTLASCGGNANAQAAVEPLAPLTLKSFGSFFVGGRVVAMTTPQVGQYTGGSMVVDQMYVQYAVPNGEQKPSVVMAHGAALTGASFETTPDGRMGWFEYFARKGYPSYNVDQVGRGRSGFNHAPFNDVRAGVQPPGTQPVLRRVADEIAWARLRLGPSNGVKFDDSQYPVEAISEFAKQTVPDVSQAVPPNDPNYAALSQLAQKLEDTILLGHSQSGTFPFETALRNPKGIRSLIAVEPPGCNATTYTDEQIGRLAKFPILVVFGDHVDMRQPIGSEWGPLFRDCQAFVERINAAKGNAKMLHPASMGIRGNSHMIMQDKNNLLIADLIIDWIKQK